MRKFMFIYWVLIVTVLLFAPYVYALEISFVVGDVIVERDGKENLAVVGMKLSQGDVVVTKNASIAELLYSDKSTLRIFENTKIKVAAIQDNQENVSVINGVIKAKISKLQKGESKKVYTPTTVCAIRGTEFFVAVSDSSNSRVNMEEGSLALANPYGEISVNNDEQATVEVAKKPLLDDNPKNPELWKNTADKDFVLEPQKYAESYNEYLSTLEQRSSMQSAEIEKYKQSSAKKKDSKKIEKDMDELENKVAVIADDFFLGDCANAAVDNVLQMYKEKKQEIFDSFNKVKEQADRVVQQQKANYEAIMAIKEAYRKNYEEIKGKHKESIEKIKEEINKVHDQ
ncbi:MAG TPA: FecR family protein [Spirochaetota bacterium]|nr:FecR family protein [Spirochaetota bacterium]HOM09151.1 FecR family protein [Spirochaetota bacterium]HPP49000.1 FecR family protein [Spirochaetota bacterium]